MQKNNFGKWKGGKDTAWLFRHTFWCFMRSLQRRKALWAHSAFLLFVSYLKTNPSNQQKTHKPFNKKIKTRNKNVDSSFSNSPNLC
ncbi:Hypothetical protein, putative [Bodo saltans]|uniref:Uncharacterized protein n=1 Tax=Bodo saltans TaxID=75058 RepID=A0A0S4JQD2_BODSA|nr:Hypothetical protein, putative [Bodo saltans]|eukprot:CUG92949.1 Hypothetical protein, putative [Bodo saltans]